MCMCMLRPLIGCRCACRKSLFITWARCKGWTLNAIHQKNHYPVDRVECYHNTYRWILIHSVDSVIHPLNNRGLVFWEFFFSWFPPSKWFYIKRIIIKVGSLQFFCLFFDRCPPGYLRQLLQFAFVLFKSGSCLFQELSVPCGSIALAGSCRYVNHPKTGFFGMAIFNLRCSFSFALGSIPYRRNVLILTFSVLMQSNPTCFFFFFRLLWGLQPLPLSSVGHFKQSGSRTSQFMLEAPPVHSSSSNVTKHIPKPSFLSSRFY